MTYSAIRFGVVGCGMHAQLKLLPSLSYVNGVSLVALCDADVDTVQQLKNKYTVERGYSDYKEMLHDPSLSLDAVIIATPSYTHAAIATDAINCGKHTFIEKPIATSLEDAHGLLHLEKKTGQKVMVGHHRRFGTLEKSAVDLFRKNMIGKPLTINSVHNFSIDSRAALSDYLEKRGLSGGVMLEYACHDIDFLRFLLQSDVKQVYAQLASNQTDDDTATISMEFENGTLANLMLCSCTIDSERLEIFGTEGRIMMDRYQTVKAELDMKHQLKNRKMRVLKSFFRGWKSLQLVKYLRYKNMLTPYIAEFNHFVECIREDKEPFLSLEEGIAPLKVISSAFESVKTGRSVSVS